MVLPNLEFAVLRVAIDHMIEHLEDVGWTVMRSLGSMRSFTVGWKPPSD